MEPATIAAGAVALLVPYVQKAAESFAGKVGEAVYAKTTSLLNWLKTKFSKDEEGKGVIRRFEESPEKYQPFLEDVLRERLSKDSSFSEELIGLIQEIKTMAPTLNVVQQMEKAEEVTGARIGEMTRGTANVKQEIKDAKKITGAHIDKM
jgi:hypothetical protein